jgi:hypothetical protein
MNNLFKTTTLCIAAAVLLTATCPAVTSVITRHKSGDVLSKGTMENTVVDSRGIIRLAPKTEKLGLEKELEEVWAIHTILADKTGTLYIGTSPQGKVIRVRDGKTDVLYPKAAEQKEAPVVSDPNVLQQEPQPNEHVFAMAFDVAGRVLAGVSGDKGKVLRISSGTEVLFENEKVRYIFAIALDKQNNIYLGTGPNGQLWGLDAFGQNPRLICTLEDKNILSLTTGENGVLYAGTDTRGIIHKIDSKTGKINVLFDSGQDEITSLVLSGDGKLFAAASSAEAGGQPFQVAVPIKRPAGRPDAPSEGTSAKSGGQSLKTANSDEQKTPPGPQPKPASNVQAPKSIGMVYEITGEGFVDSIFEEKAIFYTLFEKSGKLLLGTGPQAKLFSIDPKTEERTLIFQDKTSSQITAAAFDGKDVYVAMANPAAIVCVKDAFAEQGRYLSELIDARQPARWGKMQLDADIPDGCEIWVATRSGNLGEPNDATFSSWSNEVKITESVEAGCPVGRFCQYRLTLKTNKPDVTPQVREISIAQAIPNLEPKVTMIAIQKADKQKSFMLMMTAKAEDDNKDTLEYAFEYRKLGRQGWILLKDKLEQPKYEWDSRTVEDGRYEVRVTANDRLSNGEQTALSNARISDPVIIDNTAPAIIACKIKTEQDAAALELAVEDELSILGKVQYTVDSDSEWKSVMPADGMFDSTREMLAFEIKGLSRGEHVIAIRVADDIDNTMYKSYVVEIK